jgi:hypothetical protein
MANRKRTSSPKRHTSRLRKFPEVKGKIVDSVEMDAEVIAILFQDKTQLSFDLDPQLTVYPELADFKTGNLRSMKQWPALRSKPTMLRWP